MAVPVGVDSAGADEARAHALANRTRAAVLRHLAATDRPVGVAELVERFGVHHNAVRRHLARLVAAGLVVAVPERRAGRGRPHLAYRPSPAVAPSGEAPYERLAGWLSRIISTGASPRAVGRAVGGEGVAGLDGPDHAEVAAEAVDAFATAMARHGFAPAVQKDPTGRATLRLGACPYASVAAQQPDVVCQLHLGLAEGTAAAVGHLVVDDLVPADPVGAGCLLHTHCPDAEDAPHRGAGP